MSLLNQVVFIMAITDGILLTFAVLIYDVSTLVGMTRHNICIIKMLGYNWLESNISNRLFFFNYLTLLLLCCYVILGMNRMIFIMKYHF